MNTRHNKFAISTLLAIGSVWGLSEAGVGMYLRGMCTRTITGSVMTGAAMLFMATALGYSRKTWSLLLLLGVASVFKLFDAYLLGLPVLHGAIANPIFAFFTEVFAFILIYTVLDAHLREKPYGRIFMGGMAALVAVNLFPLVRFATRIPACVYPGTKYPLALYYAPIAIGISAITCPAGMLIGEKFAQVTKEKYASARMPLPMRAVFRFIPIMSLVLMVLIRKG